MQRPINHRGPPGGGGSLGGPARPPRSSVPVTSSPPEYGGSSRSRSLSYSSNESVTQTTVTARKNAIGVVIKRVYAFGYDECIRMINDLKDGPEQLFVVFLGTKGPTGRNWCPDCIVGEDLIEKCLEKLRKSVIVLYVDVGDRVFWKTMDNIWRRDKVLRLTNIPTVIEWRKKLRLDSQQCHHFEVIQMFFESD